MKFVTDGCGRQPAAARPAARRGALALDAGDVGAHLRPVAERARSRRSRRSCRRSPGGRYRAIAAKRRGRARPRTRRAARPARRPCDAVRTTTRFGYRVRSGITRAPDELAVGLVHDDGGHGPAVGGRVGRRCPSSSVSMAPVGLRRGRSGCWGCRARRASPRGRPSRTAGDVHRPALAAGPSRGTAMTRAAALLGMDPVHGVGRGRDHGGLARGQERLGAHVEDLVGAGARDELVGRDAVDGRGRLDEAPVVRRAGTPTGGSRTRPPRGAARRGRAGRATC